MRLINPTKGNFSNYHRPRFSRFLIGLWNYQRSDRAFAHSKYLDKKINERLNKLLDKTGNS